MSSLAAERRSEGCAGAPAPPGFDDATVRLLGASKRFGEITALEDATLSIRRGELMTLLGPSGCGKTTLLNLVAGFLVADSGEIEIDGKRVNDLPTYKREIGMMFQNYALFPHMSIADNVGYGLRMRGIAKPELKRRVAEALSLVRLAGVEDRRPHQLSGGQQQRVALARALVISPKVLLLDEPFSALDRNLRASMQIEIKEIQRQLGVTTIFVTHDQGEALSLSDRIAVMFEGRIRQVGTPDEIYRRPADRFVASFVGDVNVLRARLDRVDGQEPSSRWAQQGYPFRESRSPESAPAIASICLYGPNSCASQMQSEPIAVEGTVAAHIYQGGHVNLYLDAPEVCTSRLLVRSLEPDAITRWPTGTRVGVSIVGTDAIAFEAEPDQRDGAPRACKAKRRSPMPARKADSVATAYLALLAERGVEYLFGNAGTDFAPIVEAYAEAEQKGTRVPQPILATHENLAVTMAHGYAMVSRKIPAVMVHVSVGTANMVCAAMNAARENVAILLTAGRSPITEAGLLGSRDGYIHWAQEMYDQAGMIRELVKWDYELRNGEQLETVVDRALSIAATEPRGPVYLSLPREVIAAHAPRATSDIDPSSCRGSGRARRRSHRRGGAG